jgi:flavodoxin
MINILLSISLLISACSSSQMKETGARSDTMPAPGKILIVYLSRTNNTKAIAEIIQENTGGRSVALELEKPYPENYQATVQQVANENESGYLPPLKTKIDSIENYDIVFVGFPTWGMQLPPPMKSFLKQYNLGSKIIVPFNTNGGYGTGNSFDKVKEQCPNSNVLNGFTMRGGSERDGQYLVIRDEKRKEAEIQVKQWLQKLELTRNSP